MNLTAWQWTRPVAVWNVAPARHAVLGGARVLSLLLAFSWAGSLMQVWAQQAARSDSSLILPDGTDVVTRVVPVPGTVSAAAQKRLARVVPDVAGPVPTIAQQRAGVDQWQAGAAEQALKMFPVKMSLATMAGVPVRVVMPLVLAADKQDKVLINVHGGGFVVDSGSLVEPIPIANLTGVKVVSVLYRIAPEHPFPAAVDDTVAVYRELLKTYQPKHIGIYGSSAGAMLTAEVTVKLRLLGLPLPGVTGIFSGDGDFAHAGDSVALYGLNGFAGHHDVPSDDLASLDPYVGSTDLRDPVLSPIYADLRGFPPTLFVSSGRDLLLSSTTVLHRAYLRAGVEAELVVFEGLPHTFWNEFDLPESQEALRVMASFLGKHL